MCGSVATYIGACPAEALGSGGCLADRGHDHEQRQDPSWATLSFSLDSPQCLGSRRLRCQHGRAVGLRASDLSRGLSAAPANDDNGPLRPGTAPDHARGALRRQRLRIERDHHDWIAGTDKPRGGLRESSGGEVWETREGERASEYGRTHHDFTSALRTPAGTRHSRSPHDRRS
jgi:hypothetical protein